MNGRAPEQSLALAEALRAVDTPTVANAIEAFEVRDRADGFASRDIRCEYPDLGPLVGYAVTCTIDSTTGGPRRPTRLGDLLDAVAAAPKPTVVIGQYVGSDRSRGCFIGDLFASLFVRVGAIGIVTDTPNRDLPVLHERAPGFHVFGPGSVASHGNGSVIDVDIPVTIGGLQVHPGDLIHADASGVITIPLEVADRIVDQADRIWAAEQATYEMIRDASVPLDQVKARFAR